jgi:hypothetical protein
MLTTTKIAKLSKMIVLLSFCKVLILFNTFAHLSLAEHGIRHTHNHEQPFVP